MKLSEIFRRAARNLPEDCQVGIGEQINDEFKKWEKKICSRIFDGKETEKEYKKLFKAYNKALSILKKKFKPKFFAKTTQEAQKIRKEILLKCAEIAESEGL